MGPSLTISLLSADYIVFDDTPVSRHFQESHNAFIFRVKQFEKCRLLDCVSTDLKASQSSETLALCLSTCFNFLEVLKFQHCRCKHFDSRNSMFQTDYFNKDPGEKGRLYHSVYLWFCNDTYLLTYSMVQSPSLEVNWFEASQEIPRISRNPKVHYRTHKCPPPVSTLGQPNPVHIATSHLLKIHPNIIHPSTPRSPQWSLLPSSFPS